MLEDKNKKIQQLSLKLKKKSLIFFRTKMKKNLGILLFIATIN